jgi:hypothetical protein
MPFAANLSLRVGLGLDPSSGYKRLNVGVEFGREIGGATESTLRRGRDPRVSNAGGILCRLHYVRQQRITKRVLTFWSALAIAWYMQLTLLVVCQRIPGWNWA